jgi:hypothetical protein
MRNQSCLYDLPNEELDDYFNGSVDRFCDIAWEIRNAKRVLGAAPAYMLHAE